MNRLRIRDLAVVLMLLAPLGAEGQSVPEGERIRVTAPPVFPEPQVGRLVSLGATTLVLESGPTDGEVRQWVVPVEELIALDVYQGSRGNGLKGALIGGGLGFAGTLLALSNASCEADNGGNLCVMAATYVGLGGALLGALVGAVIRTEQWTPAENWR